MATSTVCEEEAVVSESPRHLAQVPLDRATQALYAKIYAAMDPLRRSLSNTPLVSESWAGALRSFHESLPGLSGKVYADFRAELARLVEVFGEAVDAPMSTAARDLCSQIVCHDLPRVAALATKLNEAEAPKFFATISKDESDASVRHFMTPDIAGVARVKKSDLENALATIVNTRMQEAERLVRGDLQRWLAAKGVDGPELVVAEERAQYVFRKAGSSWQVIFEGGDGFVIDDTLGAKYLDWLLHHPNAAISALDLEQKITFEKEAVRGKEAFAYGLDPVAIKAYLRRLNALRGERDRADQDGDAGACARIDGEIETIEGELKKRGRSKDSGEKARGNVRKSIGVVKRRLAKGGKNEKAFHQHIEDFVKTGYKCMYAQSKGQIWQ